MFRYDQSEFFLKNRTLAATLRAAPNLKSLMLLTSASLADGPTTMSEIYTARSDAGIVDLVYLHDRVSCGLEVTSSMCGGRGDFLGVNVYVWLGQNDGGDAEEEDFLQVAEYFAALPTFPEFKGLKLSSDILQANFASLMQEILRVFPNLEALTFWLEDTMCSRDLKHLEAFTHVQYLALGDMQLCSASLALLSNRMPMLQVLYLTECGDFDAARGNELQVLLQDWGITTQVVVG